MHVDPSAALGFLTDAQEKQLPYVVMLALNRTANDAQKAERDRLKIAFKLRRSDWNLRGIYISKADRATKTSWSVVIQIQPDRDYLDKFEAGEYKIPTKGRWLWQPNPDVFKNAIISASNPLNPHNLHFNKVGHSMLGNERTYMLPGKDGPLVFQRVTSIGTRKDFKRLTLDNFKGGMGPAMKKEKYSLTRTEGTQLLYRLVSRIKVPASLEFVGTVGATVRERWFTNMTDAMTEAMRTAK